MLVMVTRVYSVIVPKECLISLFCAQLTHFESYFTKRQFDTKHFPYKLSSKGMCMRLIVTGNHLPLSSALNTYAANKLSKLERLASPSDTIHLTLNSEKKYRRCIQARLVSRGVEYHVASYGSDPYAIIDELKRKLCTQLLKTKEYTNTHTHKKMIEARSMKQAGTLS